MDNISILAIHISNDYPYFRHHLSISVYYTDWITNMDLDCLSISFKHIQGYTSQNTYT